MPCSLISAFCWCIILEQEKVKASPSEVESFQKIPLRDSTNDFLLLGFNVKKQKPVNQNKVVKVGYFVNVDVNQFLKDHVNVFCFLEKMKLKALTLVSKSTGVHGAVEDEENST